MILTKVKLRQAISRCILKPSQKGGRLIVFVYHALTDQPDNHPDQMSLSVSLFAKQMEWLKILGFPVVSLKQGIALLQRGALNSPVVALTFDDGFLSVYTRAFPILQQYGYSATFFLVPGVLEGLVKADFMTDRLGPPLSWSQAREMLKYGMEFGAHSMTHRKLSSLPLAELTKEVCDSKQLLEDRLSIPITDFAYPFGSFDAFNDACENVLIRHRFQSVSTTVSGHNTSAQDVMRLKRLRLSWVDASLDEFERECLGYYNWYAHYQRAQSFLSALLKS